MRQREARVLSQQNFQRFLLTTVLNSLFVSCIKLNRCYYTRYEQLNTRQRRMNVRRLKTKMNRKFSEGLLPNKMRIPALHMFSPSVAEKRRGQILQRRQNHFPGWPTVNCLVQDPRLLLPYRARKIGVLSAALSNLLEKRVENG